jgi:anaerobic selenocysteine-containing dehydrogenase
MNQQVREPRDAVRIPSKTRVDVLKGASACPHDCPSTCALEVELLDARTIGRIRGAAENAYTAGVICAKVARYAERIHHKDRIVTPLRRKGPKGSGDFVPVSWDDALDITAEALARAGQRHGAEAVWPYYYAGTMGLVMRDGINRLRHAKKYSGFHSTICVNPAFSGFAAGTGKIAGVDPREMAKSDLIVLWGTNAVNTQVNVMTHATRARKERGAMIAAVDVYMNGTMTQADLPVLIRPGTDGALACAVMHCLFRDGHADRDYLARYTDAPDELEAHVAGRGYHGVRHGHHRSIRAADRRAQARLLPARLRFLPLAQRRRQHARGELHPRRHRRVAAGGRRRVPQQRRHLPFQQDDDRRPRCARPVGPHARSVAHRRDPHGRPRRARLWAAG